MLPEIKGTLVTNPPWREFSFSEVLMYYDGPRLAVVPGRGLLAAWGRVGGVEFGNDRHGAVFLCFVGGAVFRLGKCCGALTTGCRLVWWTRRRQVLMTSVRVL